METHVQSDVGIDSTSEFDVIERHIFIVAEVEEFKVFMFVVPLFLFY